MSCNHKFPTQVMVPNGSCMFLPCYREHVLEMNMRIQVHESSAILAATYVMFVLTCYMCKKITLQSIKICEMLTPWIYQTVTPQSTYNMVPTSETWFEHRCFKRGETLVSQGNNSRAGNDVLRHCWPYLACISVPKQHLRIDCSFWPCHDVQTR